MNNKHRYNSNKQIVLRTFIRENVPDYMLKLFVNELRRWDHSFTTIANASTYGEGLLWMLYDQAIEKYN